MPPIDRSDQHGMKPAHAHPQTGNRRWFQYSLRTLLVLVTAFAVACSWFACRLKRAERQKNAVESLTKSGARVFYDYEVDQSRKVVSGAKPPGPAWLRDLVGDHFLTTVVVVDLNHEPWQEGQITDADLEPVESLAGLRILTLRGTQITDEGLERIKGLAQLQDFDLSQTKVTDAGLQHVKGLRRCWMLDLGGTRVTALDWNASRD